MELHLYQRNLDDIRLLFKHRKITESEITRCYQNVIIIVRIFISVSDVKFECLEFILRLFCEGMRGINAI